MAPVALRKKNKEKVAQGLVIALALYGEEDAVLTTAPERLAQAAAAAIEKQKKTLEESTISTAGAAGVSGGVEEEGKEEIPQISEISENGDNISVPLADAATLQQKIEKEMPLAVIDVTLGLQYLVDSSTSSIILHQGYSKSGLMGFCDPAPLSTKLLLVYYTYQGVAYMAKVSDTEGVKLPGRGSPVENAVEVELVKILAAA